MTTSRKSTATIDAPEETGAAVLEDDFTPDEVEVTEAEAPAEAVEEAPAAEAQEENVAKEESEQQKKNRLRNEAEREVLNNHRDEFYEVAERKFKENGLEFTRRMTEEEKAAKKLKDLLAQHPNLRSMIDA